MMIFIFILFLIVLNIIYNYKNPIKKPVKKLKIGILLNYTFMEIEKEELVFPNDNSPDYIKKIPKHHLIRNSYINNKKKNNILGYPYDLVIGYCIKWMRPDIEVNFITPDNMSVEEFHKNDLVFIIIYDLLEALNIDKLLSQNELNTNIKFNKDQYKKLKKILEQVNNVYPSYEYQKIINSKCNYYKLILSNKLSINNFKCVTLHRKNTIDEIINYLEHVDLLKKSFVTKPDNGSDSIGFAVWLYKKKNKDDNIKKDQYIISYNDKNDLINKLDQYLKIMKNYNKIIVQKKVNGFYADKNNEQFSKITTEFKSYYIGNNYKYAILVDDYCYRQPAVDGGSNKYINCNDNCALGDTNTQCKGPEIDKFHYDKMKKLGKSAMKILPPIIINGKVLPKLLTRIDIGLMSPYYSQNNKNRDIFINEIEFVPSLFHVNIKVDVIKLIAEQMINIIEIYKK